ncbi:Uncharacterised protein [Salmonella enterica subsp. enterica serovar Bovismorbificans]|uniref:Uncharacterized protein n=1 Tax=Salmonella enterica subsp. enterica serovar Bovismorbificans TaxID=58097 RepID=A0A655BYD3_SALET|nr:hypothetical protein VI31_10545 [Salmonella enterica subsp. enterica serovar Mishmarhaemek]CNT86917.1 Uncharacterised protein [Salmonella enterica subsp. enterica serovar Bovismorbificans]CNU32145.1 Uncharacterised protein [Salmonella enterica subsp. enterica serovar Bovismorbificans]CNU68672.1 Uncharacterised protein [Salmonella enterica subsp. enterica serovar Bovismorbificans]
MTLKDSLKSTCLQVLEAGPVLCASQDGRTTAQYGQQVAHANLSARQAKENNLMMSGTYGPPFIGLQASNALSLYLANSLQAKMQKSGSTLYKLTWKVWAMPSGRRRFRLRASVRRTSGSVLTGWPTPTASNTKNAYQDAEKVIARKLAGRRSNLQDFACLAGWPTPAARDGKGGYQGGRMRHGKLSTDTLDVTAQIAGPARLTDSGDLLTGFFAEMESGGQLNPALSLWLMGFPPEWENYAPAETP